MFTWKDFGEEYDFLGVGINGAVFFGVENLKDKRNTVLKLSLCINKAETIKEISFMQIC